MRVKLLMRSPEVVDICTSSVLRREISSLFLVEKKFTQLSRRAKPIVTPGNMKVAKPFRHYSYQQQPF